MRWSPLENSAPQECLCYEEATDCLCDATERSLRAYTQGWELPEMTCEQRAWCLQEIHAVEGYDRKDYADCSDADLARGVLAAYAEYCRDKGLL